MRFTEILLLLLVAWTVIGAIGVTLSFLKGEHAKARKNLGWIAGIWSLYLVVLLGTSFVQKRRIVAAGTPQCFDQLCFTVTGMETLPGYLMQQGRLLRVKIAVQNRGETPQSDLRVHTYLVDQNGRRWNEVPGLSGVRLDTRVPAGRSIVSEPVFKLPADVTPVGVVFTRGSRQPGVLVIGDPDSLLHPPTIVRLTQ